MYKEKPDYIFFQVEKTGNSNSRVKQSDSTETLDQSTEEPEQSQVNNDPVCLSVKAMNFWANYCVM